MRVLDLRRGGDDVVAPGIFFRVPAVDPGETVSVRTVEPIYTLRLLRIVVPLAYAPHFNLVRLRVGTERVDLATVEAGAPCWLFLPGSTLVSWDELPLTLHPGAHLRVDFRNVSEATAELRGVLMMGIPRALCTK